MQCLVHVQCVVCSVQGVFCNVKNEEFSERCLVTAVLKGRGAQSQEIAWFARLYDLFLFGTIGSLAFVSIQSFL